MDEEKERVSFSFLNDWPVRRFQIIGLATIVAVLLFASARSMFEVLPFTNYLGFALLPLIVLVPGAAILRVLRIHDIGFSKATFYSLALGIMLIMVMGGGLNVLHYTSSIQSPFSLPLICTTYSAILAILLMAVGSRDSDYSPTRQSASMSIELLLTMAFAVLLPFVVVTGTTLAGYWGDRSIIYYALVAICAAPLIVFAKNTKSYEILILSLSLSLLLHRGLMTNYLMGYDVFSEYYTAYTSTANGFWDVFRPFGANTAMSMTTLAPMLTNLTSIQTIELLKIAFPILFSFAGLAVYKIVEGQLGSRPALVATMIFIGYQAFYALMVQLTKQQMAEIFLLLFFMSALDTSIIRRYRRAFVVVGLFGIVVSHYALAYIAIGLVVGFVALNALWHLVVKIKEKYLGLDTRPLHKWFIGTVWSWLREQRRAQIISLDIAIIFLAIFYIWFSVTASGMMLQYGENVDRYVGPTTGSSGSGQFLLYQMDALEFLLIDYGNVLHNVEKYLVVLAQAICVIGVIYAIRRFGSLNSPTVGREFVLFGALAAMIIVGCYTIPRLSYSFYFARFFHVTFLLISGFFPLGIYALVKIFRRTNPHGLDVVKHLRKDRVVLGICSMFLILFLLFNSGTIYHAIGGYSNSFALDPGTSWSTYSDSDVMTGKWLAVSEHRGNYAATVDWHRFPLFGGVGAPVDHLQYQWTQNQTDKLMYLSSWNVQMGWGVSSNRNGSSLQSYTPLSDILSQVDNRTEVVFSTGGGAKVVYIPSMEPETNPVGPPFSTYEETPIYVLSGLALATTAAGIISIISRGRRRKSI
ncbi:MAG: hypothetical protein A4E30_00029 [Methanomassiliicoccales archaeon PtaB.Bin215]|nr:MAG: hypothetical protein A4E30_00029 [Methanomassiliicoccales archaeon PtaB.Bin215]